MSTIKPDVVVNMTEMHGPAKDTLPTSSLVQSEANQEFDTKKPHFHDFLDVHRKGHDAFKGVCNKIEGPVLTKAQLLVFLDDCRTYLSYTTSLQSNAQALLSRVRAVRLVLALCSVITVLVGIFTHNSTLVPVIICGTVAVGFLGFSIYCHKAAKDLVTTLREDQWIFIAVWSSACRTAFRDVEVAKQLDISPDFQTAKSIAVALQDKAQKKLFIGESLVHYYHERQGHQPLTLLYYTTSA